MERLTEQIVDWHNRHPLAKRISPIDVHTVGVVALPFMRQSRRASMPQEPVLNQVVDPIHEAETRDALDPAAEPAGGVPAEIGQEVDEPESNEPGVFSSFETETAAKSVKGASWAQALQALWFRLRRQRWGNHWQWPVFSEHLIPKLSPARVARFALAHGYNEAPGDPDWPRRLVALDDDYVARGSAKHRAGAWPFELFLVSAGIDAGKSRSRVLVGQGSGRRLEIAGRRCMSPLRVGAAGALLLLTVGLGWFRFAGGNDVAEQNAAALAAAMAASAPASAPASATSAAPLPASAPASMAAASEAAAVVAASATASGAASGAASAAAQPTPAGASAVTAGAPSPLSSGPRLVEPPDIRPQLVSRATPAPPLHHAASAQQKQSALASVASPAVQASGADSAPATATPGPGDALAATDSAPPPVTLTAVSPNSKQVALVGPSSAKREDAEALLAKMQETMKPMVGNADALQSQVFKTPTGYAPAIWPFATREQAQLIDAVMIARGLHTRAVDF